MVQCSAHLIFFAVWPLGGDSVLETPSRTFSRLGCLCWALGPGGKVQSGGKYFILSYSGAHWRTAPNVCLLLATFPAFLVTSSLEWCGTVDMLSFSNVALDLSTAFYFRIFAVDQFAILYLPFFWDLFLLNLCNISQNPVFLFFFSFLYFSKL